MKYKVGTKVIHHQCDNDACNDIGWIGVITMVRNSYYQVRFDNSDKPITMPEHLIKPHTIKPKIDKLRKACEDR